MESTRTKLSITLAPDVVRAVDRAAKAQPGASRSSIIETWLRRAARISEEERMRVETVAYYESRSEQERREDDAWARASSRRARRLKLDDG